MHRHDRRCAEQAAEGDFIADRLARSRDEAHGGRLGIDHTDGGLVRDDGGDRLRARVAGDGDHIKAHRAHARHGFELIQRQNAASRGGDHALVLGHRDKRAGQSADRAGRHQPALLDRVIEKRQCRRRSMRPAGFKAHFLQNARHAVAHGGCRGEGQVDHAERHAQPPGRFPRHQLAHTRDAEGRFLDALGHLVKGPALDALQRVVHHARPGYADAHDRVGLAHAVERTRHERVVLDRVAEHDELRAAKSIAFLCQLGRLFDRLPHKAHSVHVDARLCRGDVDAGADQLRLGQRLRDGGDQPPVAGGHALLHERGKAADEIHAAGLCGAVHRLGKRNKILRLARACDQRDGRDGNALVDDGNAKLPFDLAACRNQMLGLPADLVVNFPGAGLRIRVGAVQKRNAHGDGADVQMLMVDHIDRGHDIGMVQHDLSPPSDGVHGSENILPLDADGQAHLFALFCDAGLYRVKLRRACRPFDEHDHGKRALHDGLADLHDADVEFCQQRADLGDDADPVGADDGDNGFHVSFLLCADMEKGPCGPLFIFRISYARPASSSVR